eukprot:Nk52_evm11s470 gene=Nk52_evmTU11s470
MPHQHCASLLRPGMVFKGSQKVSNTYNDEWKVVATVQGVDFETGLICGTMEAQYLNAGVDEISCASSFWEGHIIDNKQHSFFTNQWEATHEIDVYHWCKFKKFAKQFPNMSEDVDDDSETFQGFKRHLEGLTKAKMEEEPYIYMRWKEVSFTNQNKTLLHYITIAGFYYVCFNRETGEIHGFYFDPSSMPYQELRLAPVCENSQERGVPSCVYEFQ